MKAIIFILLIVLWIIMYYLGTDFAHEQIKGEHPDEINWYMIAFLLLMIPIIIFA